MEFACDGAIPVMACCHFRHFPRGRAAMKQINAFPLIAMLVLTVALILWLGGYFA